MNKKVTVKAAPSTIEKVLVEGDLAPLTTEQRVQYHDAVCKSLGLNPLTRPFQYMKLNGKIQLYASKDCSEQLRRKHKISLEITDRKKEGQVYIVTAKATNKDRTDESTGVVSLQGLQGNDLANAYMKAETKAKRRVTLSICGLGLLDETEVHDVPNTVRDIQQPVVKPQPKPATPVKPEKPVSELTQKDMQSLTALIEESKFTVDQAIAECEKRWKVKSAAQLNRKQFTELCEILAGGPASESNEQMEDAQISDINPPVQENQVSQ